MCGRRCLSIVVVKRVLIFFFFSFPNPNANPFFCSRRGGEGEGRGCDANMSTQQNRLLVKTRTLLQPGMKTHKKVNTNCPRYDHTQSHTNARDGRWNVAGANLGGSGVKKESLFSTEILGWRELTVSKCEIHCHNTLRRVNHLEITGSDYLLSENFEN